MSSLMVKFRGENTLQDSYMNAIHHDTAYVWRKHDSSQGQNSCPGWVSMSQVGCNNC